MSRYLCGAILEAVLEVETSPQNYQAMLKLPESLARPDRKAVERLLQSRYGSDLGSADGGHYARLAGFTNRKPQHVGQDGRFPFVKLSASRQAVLSATSWQPLKAAAEQAQADELMPLPQALPFHAAPAVGGVMDYRSAAESAKRQFAAARARWGAGFDLSRADYFISRNLLQRGASRETVVRAIRHESPDLDTRKAGHIDDYLGRTVNKAYSSIPGIAECDRAALDIAQAAIESAARAERDRAARMVAEQDRARHHHPGWKPPKPK